MELREPYAKYLPPQFKRTEAGDIPIDWVDKPIGEMAEVTSGGTPSRKMAAYWNGDIPWVTTAELEVGQVTEAVQHITAAGLQNSAAKWLPAGTLLIALYGQGKTRGKCAVLRIAATTNQACAGIKLKESVEGEFVRHNLAQRYEYIRSLSNGGSQENLSGEIVKKIRVGMPSTRAEQRAIAEALNDADALIDSLEQLLTKKRQMKQGAMQELLTGKRRLPGFSDSWISCLWGDVIDDCSSGATPLRSHPEYYRGSIRWVSSGELNYNVIEETLEHISAEALEKANLKIHPAGTFLMAITGLEAAGTRGACGMIGKPAATNQSCMAIYPSSKLLTAYLFHFYVYKGDELALRYCQGTKQQSYTAALVRVLPIEYPESTDEQLAIAQVLSDIDAEITALESRLTKTLALKQAMAQALLTGRIRIPLAPQEPAAPVLFPGAPEAEGVLWSGPARAQEPTP